MNLIAGLLEPTAGSIWLDDVRLDHVPPEKRDFGMVFQNYALFPHMSVADNVGFGLSLRRVGKAERRERVQKALDMVQLGSQAAKRPSQLSGGQQQRVAIARAIVTEPRLVLMDEPLSNLDAKLRIDMRTEVRLLHQDLGLTTIYVTHDQAEALSLADRLVVMREGVVQQTGAPQEVYESPDNIYVAAFVGYRNAIDGRVGRDGRIDIGDASLVVADAGDRLGGAPHAVAMVRPDDVTIAAADAAPGEARANAIPVTVRVSEYQGRVFAVEAQTAGGTTVFGYSETLLQPGTAAVASIAAESIRVYGEDAPHGAARAAAAEAELAASGVPA
ncbi:ABC transporter ATP-binding protein [Pseudolysinimonas kribbensis]|uniref:ABC transporter ATP-binding protein n=1 Tax=Pseudolysinimonas kribbensis TaxID=433641 RepID=A0ABQ6K646_9MICO|nr:ABC transporter ATP-binding protein [Pseudolysinimonas kribbensis]GMA96103.1 ABC transporter ATP-binding protein [Pseudolysinimonas kribbensis]